MASVSSSEYSDKKHVLTFTNKLLQFEIIYNNISKYYMLNCNVYVVNETEKRLKKIENGVENAAQFRYQQKAVILDCNLVTIGESQLQIPVILIGKKYNQLDKLKLLLVTVLSIDNGDRFELVYWGVPMKITYALNLNVKLTDGPIIFWFKNQFLYINYLLTTNSRYVTMKIMLPDVVSPSLLCLKSEYEQISSTTTTTTFIVNLFLIVRTQSSSYLTKILLKPYENSINVESNTTLKQSAHEKYLTRAQSVSFVDDYRQKRFLCSVSNGVGELVEFDYNGSVTNINTDIGFTADRMIVHYTCRSRSDQRYVIIQSRSKASVVKTYDDVSDVYVGNFFRFGPSTILLMVNRVPDKDLEECRIIKMTDLNSDNLTSKNATEEVCIEPSLVAAKKALETRSIAGREAVKQNEKHLEHLDRVVNNVCQTLHEATIGHEARRSEQMTPLFNLLNSETDGRLENVSILDSQTLVDNECYEPLHVGRPWQRIINDKWIIGIEITNITKGPIWGLHFVLSSKERELTHTTNLFRMKSYSSSIQTTMKKPPRKKFKSEDDDLPSETENILESFERVILTTSLDIGFLKHESELSINTVVTFEQQVNSNIRNSYVKCPSIVLSVDTLLKDKFRTNFQEENDISELLCDFAAVRATTEATEVTLVSKHTDMFCLEETIKKSSCGFGYAQHLSVFYWNKSERDVLSGVFFNVTHIENKSKAHLMTYTKNQSQFFTLVHYLYNVLPEDIVILPHSDNEVPRSSANTSLSQEINFIKDFFEKDTPDNERSDLRPLRDVSEVRKTYEEQTNQNSRSKEFQTFNVSDYIRFRKDLLLLETKTDKLIISESTTKNS